MTPHRITSSPCSIVSGSLVSTSGYLLHINIISNVVLGIPLACVWNFRRFFFLNSFPGRSNRDTHYPYSTCRQEIEISFLGMTQIAHFQVEKWKSSLPWEGGVPHPPPARSLRSLGLVDASLPRKDCAPPNVLAHYATDSAIPIMIKVLHSVFLPQSLDSESILHSQFTFSTPWGAFQPVVILQALTCHSTTISLVSY